MTEVSAWVALDDVDEGNGCMRMVRGSHRWGDQMDAVLSGVKDVSSPPASFDGRDVEVVLRPVPKGHVHYHHALTWHASGRNPSDRPRRAVAMHFMTDQTRYVASGEHLMKPFIAVADGELVDGEAFPVVYERS
jgi:ectoine hydroxylase-related dioxygenase (phytanoyl-CoA dioxygenase family)